MQNPREQDSLQAEIDKRKSSELTLLSVMSVLYQTPGSLNNTNLAKVISYAGELSQYTNYFYSAELETEITKFVVFLFQKNLLKELLQKVSLYHQKNRNEQSKEANLINPSMTLGKLFPASWLAEMSGNQKKELKQNSPTNSVQSIQQTSPNSNTPAFESSVAAEAKQQTISLISEQLISAGLIALLTVLEDLSKKNANQLNQIVIINFILWLIDCIQKGFTGHVSPYLATKLQNKIDSYMREKNQLLAIIKNIKLQHYLSKGSLDLFFFTNTTLMISGDLLQKHFPEIVQFRLSFTESLIKNSDKMEISTERVNLCIYLLIIKSFIKNDIDVVTKLKARDTSSEDEIEKLLDVTNLYFENYVTNIEFNKKLDISPAIKITLENIGIIIKTKKQLTSNLCFKLLTKLYLNILEIRPNLHIGALEDFLDAYFKDPTIKFHEAFVIYFLYRNIRKLSENDILPKLNYLLQSTINSSFILTNPKIIINTITEYLDNPKKSDEQKNSPDISLLQKFEYLLIKLGKKLIFNYKDKEKNLDQKDLKKFEGKLQLFYKMTIERYQQDKKLSLQNIEVYDSAEFFSFQINEIIATERENIHVPLSIFNAYLSTKPEASEIFFANVETMTQYTDKPITAKFFAEMLIRALEKKANPKIVCPFIHNNMEVFAEVIKDESLLDKYFENTETYLRTLSFADNYPIFEFLGHQILLLIQKNNFSQTHVSMLGRIFDCIIEARVRCNVETVEDRNAAIITLLTLKDEINILLSKHACRMKLSLYSDFTLFEVKNWSFAHVNLGEATFNNFKGYTGQETANLKGADIRGAFELNEIIKFSDIDVKLISRNQYKFNFTFSVSTGNSVCHANVHNNSDLVTPLCAVILNKKVLHLQNTIEADNRIILDLTKKDNSKKRKADEYENKQDQHPKIEAKENYISTAGLLFKGILNKPSHKKPKLSTDVTVESKSEKGANP